ncbi:heavy metal-binding domain-containing protein [Gordonia hydrophobica]|uniref:Heavy-metal-associated domain-containing protein n=1 Tax=Gordonia hydrophobica TaxID=40516 RepID=A0ABZ2U2P5_9ACTN|nr:heavy metal-binding domain-containing protein [Gordonia hydrophobica]MBM7367266.1 hypothetical protein [Gordonia hydrophobica]
MNAPTRLSLYGLVLVAVFAVAAVVANAVVPESTVTNWTHEAEQNNHHAGAGKDDVDMATGHAGHGAGAADLGLALEKDGYRLGAVTAPAATGEAGALSFTVTGPDGKAVTAFDLEHEKELHLIVVRADGQHFRHVHPQRGADGTWSIPWTWDAGGTYRVYADFAPSATGAGMTLSTAVQVSGDYRPVPTRQVRSASSDGFTVTVAGDLVAGGSSPLTMTITRDGQPVTTLQPYLGAYGHLVALREGDLAYLHVHPHGEAPKAGQTSGPEIVFEATAPTPGRYLLYLDFQVDGQVHSVPLVLDAAESAHNHGGTSHEH